MNPPVALCLRPIRLQPEDPSPPAGRLPAEWPGPSWGLHAGDRTALEVALRLQSAGRRVVALAAGAPPAATALHACLAAGVQRAIFLELAAAASPFPAAEALADAIRSLGTDLVLCADPLQEGVGQWNAPLLAELLDWPQVTAVGSLSLLEDGQVQAWRHLERGTRQLVACPLPSVLSLRPGALPLRYLSVFRLRAAAVANLEQRRAGAAATASQAGFRLEEAGPPRLRPRRMAQPAAAMSASQRLSFLMGAGGARPRPEGGQVFTGEPAQAANCIIDFLRREGFLPAGGPPTP